MSRKRNTMYPGARNVLPQKPLVPTDWDLDDIVDGLERQYPKWWRPLGRYFGAWQTDRNERYLRVLNELVAAGLVESREYLSTPWYRNSGVEYRLALTDEEKILRAMGGR